MEPAPQSDAWIGELGGLAGEAERRGFLAARPDLHAVSTVRRLNREVRRLARADLEQAERLAEAACWIAERLGDDYSRGLSLRTLGIVKHLTSRNGEALEHYRTALELFRRSGHEVDAGEALANSLQAHIYLGQYEQAFAAAREARRIFTRRGDALRLARLDTNEGNILHRQDRFAEALVLYRRGLEAFRRLRTEPQDVGVALSNIAVCQISLDDFGAALEAYRELSAHCDRHDLPLMAVRADYNVAYLHYLRGDYTRALELYRVARRRSEDAGDPYHCSLCDLDRSEIYLDLNLTEEGQRLAEAAFAAFEELGMGYEAAKAVALRAVAASQQGRGGRALELFAEARERFVGERNRAWSARIDLYRALILHDEGRSAEARELALGAREFFLGSQQDGKAALCDAQLARIDLAVGRLDEALATCRQALERLKPLDVPALSYKVSFVLGQVEEGRGDREAAVRAYREAQELLENLRSHLQAEDMKIAFLRDKLEVYESLVAMTVGTGAGAEDHAAAFGYIEQAKSRSLADLLAFRAQSLPALAAPGSDLAQTIQRLRAELSWYYRQSDLHALQLSPPPADESGDAAGRAADEATRRRVAEKLEALRRESRRCESRLLKALNDARACDAEFGSLQVAASLDLDTIRSSLRPGTVLLEYYEARGVLYAAVVDHHRLEVLPLSDAAAVRGVLRRLQFQLSKFRLGRAYLETFSAAMHEATRIHLNELYAELVAPVAALLEGEHLVVVPHGALHYVPFHALFDGERAVLDRWSVSYAPSASVFHLCATKPVRRHRKALILGVPDHLTPAIREEVEAVASALPEAQLFVGQEATEDRLRALGRTCRTLHVATHGLFRQDNPMFSAIQLGTSRLTLFDLYQLELGASLVVLSGCGTGLSVVESGDELIGLTRGLLYAGARSVLATLWDVHDESTAAFMRSFYRHYEAGGEPAAAVRQAMQELRASHPHPYYWAPFVLIGQPFAA